ncbi:MAG: patatin-like phospholipase family protein [Deltaproteobacteria bacterium]|nr:patatin-like phospholipase family protein [Deltaproteobacteria bacterium]MBN2670305.1 patatin-like phospholipase family protein [Deltaproteobacteria bacterium]
MTEKTPSARISIFVTQDQYEFIQKELTPFVSDSNQDADFKNGVELTLKDKKSLICHLLTNTTECLEIAKSRPMGAIIIDHRHDDLAQGVEASLAGQVLPELLTGAMRRRAPSRASVVILLPDNEHTAYHAYGLGTLQLGGVLVGPKHMGDVLTAAYRISRPTAPGKVALCLAGGGIEGMFWEIGVLRALDSRLRGASLTDFDIFSGISAGAVLSAFLANGVKPYEIANTLYGRPSRVDPITRSMLFDPNVSELAKRIMSSVGDFWKGRWITRPFDSAMRVTPTAMFSGDKLREYLQREYTKPGMRNDFRELEKKLFIGVTDQDEGSHISFGAPGADDVPISSAVRASCAMTPYYNPEKIGDRYFVDGIFTRTIDIDVAVSSGATLIICIDPLRPVQTMEAGYVSGKGGLFNTVQSVKSMIRTRFAEMITKAEEANPNISVYVFSPTAKDMEQMSGTMMRFFYKPDTENMAFDSAVEQIESDKDWLREVFQRHNFELE